MKLKILLLAMFLNTPSFSYVDLVAPFTVDLLNTKHPIWDSVIITTYVSNIGSSPTPTKSYDAILALIKIDSFPATSAKKIPAYGYLGPRSTVAFKDTIRVLPGPFAISTWCDPLVEFGEDGGEIVNNVRSQAYNFHPQIYRDTILLIDTLVVRDTLKIVQKDTVKITLRDTLRISIRDTITKFDTVRVVQRDTIIKTDTVKVYQPPTFAKISGNYSHPNVQTTVYDAVGHPVWSGLAPKRGFPQVRLKQGLHLIVQGDNARRFRVAYK